jgi:sporulation protein YlmC with PRC-barrel domain
MADATQRFTIGVAVTGTDGPIGKVVRVVVDPIAEVVTHLIVEPKSASEINRLVPLSLVRSVSDDEVSIDCTVAAYAQLDSAEDTRFLAGDPGGPGGPGEPGSPGYGPGEVVAWPYYSLAMTGHGFAPGGLGAEAYPLAVTYDKVPPGETAIHRGEHVHATDGEIGRVQGLVVDSQDHHVTHVLLQEGHLWGRKEVAIPIGAVTGVDDGIRLKITKQEVQDLPPVDIDRPQG